jgi:type 2 lantibiotic biosynthesis protein LanM
VGVTPGLSDPHRNGHSVIALRFASGLKVIYKPRDIGIESAYNALLAWLNDQGITPAFKVLKMLERSTHAWIEFVEHVPCQNEAEAALYYHRAGMLIGLLYILHGADCHSGNVIACGSHPVIIDLEVLLNPIVADEIQDVDQDSAQILAGQQYQNSVISSGLLPILARAPDGTAYDLSGFGSKAVGLSFRRPQWQHVNTDQMKLVQQKQAGPEIAAVPYLNQVALSPNDYLGEMVAGFRQIYRFFLDHRVAVLDADGPLAVFKHRRSRFLFRNTGLYNQLYEFAYAPRYMKDGVERSIHLDLVSYALIASDSKPRFWPILKDEVRALQQMDIPLFSMYTDGDAVLSDTDHIVVSDAFVGDGYQQTIDTLEHMAEADMELQSGFIRASMSTRLLGTAHSQARAEQPAVDLDELVPLTQEQLVEEAAAIADTLLKSAIRTGKSMTWITLEYSPELERYQLRPLGHSLYSGLSGIALFLGALARATGEKSYHDLALAALNDLRTDIARRDMNRAARLGRRLGLGSAYGIGAVVYTFARLSQFLEDDELAEDAKRSAALLTPELIAADRCPDVFSGSAGAILGLLALYDQLPDQALLEQALACGQQVLDTRVASASGHRAWVTLNDALLTGFSHGAAGIAYALLRLYERVPDPQFLDAAREAIAYEHSVFSPADGNWPDYRLPSSERPIFATSWCHGAPGIALGRLGGLKLLDSDDIRADIDVALVTTRRALLTGGGIDHLCCGTLGRAETLFKAGQVLSRPALAEIALKVATNVVRLAKQRGCYHLFDELPDGIDNPGFFQGASGIGYQFLRFAYPELFPSVLLWE